MFDDRDALLKEDSPDGKWSLYIYGPSRVNDPELPPQPPFYASFRKKAKDSYIAVPFGRPAESSEISVIWGLPGDVCAIHIGDDCYVLFRYGLWKFRTREFFRVAPELPFSAAEIKSVETEGRLPG